MANKENEHTYNDGDQGHGHGHKDNDVPHHHHHHHDHSHDSGKKGHGKGDGSDDHDQGSSGNCLSCANPESKCNIEGFAHIIREKLNAEERDYCSLLAQGRKDLYFLEKEANITKQEIKLLYHKLQVTEEKIEFQKQFNTGLIADHEDPCCNFTLPYAEPDPCCPVGETSDHDHHHHHGG